MERIRVIHDTVGQTMTVWLDNPAKEAVCTTTEDDVVLMKDATGRVIGFEILNFQADAESGLAVETIIHKAS